MLTPPDFWTLVSGKLYLDELFFAYWFDLFELPTDLIPMTINPAVDYVRKRFFAGNYADVYEFLEVTLKHSENASNLQEYWNGVLQRNNSGYRLLDGIAVKITSESELVAVETALDVKLGGVRTHMRCALEKLGDRKNPDYRNSIKESISAVESLAKSITSNANATLGDALKVLAPAVGMHGAFREALSKLYGFTSDGNGIRHAILDEPNTTHSDALFMLVVCSAFVNYVIGKASEGKLPLT